MKRIPFIICLLGVCLVVQGLSARTLYVNKSGDDKNNGLSEHTAFLTINKAFLHLQDVDTILIGAGTYTTHATLEWNRDISIIGAGADQTIVQTSDSMIKDISSLFVSSVFHHMISDFHDGRVTQSSISGITIRNGAAPISEPMPTGVGGGIKNFSNLTVKDCIIENNVALNGGAIYNDGNLVLENTVIRGNYAFNLNGGVYNTSRASCQEIGSVLKENNTEDNLFNTTYIVSNFENGFYAGNGTNGNNEGGLIANSPNFTIVDNPDPSAVNSTSKVGKFIRKKDGNWWAYAWFEFQPIEIQYVPLYLHIMIRKPINSTVCVQVKDRHANPVSNTGELVSNAQNVVNEWQDLVFEIPNTGNYSYIEIKPDFVNAVPSSRLTEDIDIYFDEIIINGSSTPRTFSEQKLGEYPFPIANASLLPENTHASMQLSELTYSSGLLYNYNTSTGYFRPYGWPEGEKDPQKFLSFSLTPLNNSTVELNKITINHKPNTIRLGPSKIGLSYSLDGGNTFSDLPEQVISNRSAFNKSTFSFQDLSTKQPVQIRLYAWESLHGTETERDFWIIDNIELYGTVGATTSHDFINVQDPYRCFFSDDKLHVEGISNTTTIRVYNLLGLELMQIEVKEDIVLNVNFNEPFIIVAFDNKLKKKTVKVHCRQVTV
ncbi:MAG TPA: hypothetical protein PLO29_01465 [Paludibacter sp.]|nr:hypothetical protein [Paludibacter sp.]